MPWNEADREKYDVIRDRYSTDMSDAEFELISPLLPAPKKRGRKPTNARLILDAVFYMIRVGYPWRLLPKDFPPFTTVQNRFYAWRDSGLWAQIISVLVMVAREAEVREPAPTAVIVDSQSVKTTEAGGPRGFDAGKKIKGRKRHLAVDTLGLPIECQLTAASVQDRDALAPLLGAVHRKSPWVTMSFVDGGYQGEEAQRAARLQVKICSSSCLSWLHFLTSWSLWQTGRGSGNGSARRSRLMMGPSLICALVSRVRARIIVEPDKLTVG